MSWLGDFGDKLTGAGKIKKEAAATRADTERYAGLDRDQSTGLVNTGFDTAKTDIGSGYAGARTDLGKYYTDANDFLTGGYGDASAHVGAGYDAAKSAADAGFADAKSSLGAGYADATGYARDYGDMGLDYLAPYLGTGARAQSQYDIYNTGGEGGPGAQAAAWDTLNQQLAQRNQDAIDYARKQQLQGANAGPGGSRGGRELMADSRTTSLLMNQYQQQEMARLAEQAARGQGAATTAAGLRSHTGDILAQLAQQQGKDMTGIGLHEADLYSGLERGRGTDLAGLDTALAGARTGLATTQGNNLATLDTGEGNAYGQLDLGRANALKGITDDYYTNMTGASAAQHNAASSTAGMTTDLGLKAAALGIQAFSPMPLPRTFNPATGQYAPSQYTSPAAQAWSGANSLWGSGSNALASLWQPQAAPQFYAPPPAPQPNYSWTPQTYQ